MSDTLPQLNVEALALSPAEERAYPRWYTDLLLRKRSEAVAIGDALRFVDNFGITEEDKQRISRLFGAQLVTLEPAQFYVFLRLIGHVREGKSLRRELAFVSAPVPRPRSILREKSQKRSADDLPEVSNPFRKSKPTNDMDSFISLMTGSSTRDNASRSGAIRKRVTFDSRPPQIAEAAQRSMQELLRQQARMPRVAAPPPAQPLAQQHEPSPEEDEPEPTNNFATAKIDSMLHHGNSSLLESPRQPLTPNATGPTQMVQLGVLPQNGRLSSIGDTGVFNQSGHYAQPGHSGWGGIPAQNSQNLALGTLPVQHSGHGNLPLQNTGHGTLSSQRSGHGALTAQHSGPTAFPSHPGINSQPTGATFYNQQVTGAGGLYPPNGDHGNRFAQNTNQTSYLHPTHYQNLSDQQFLPQAPPRRISPMPTGDQFLTSVSRPQAPAPRTGLEITPPPTFSRRDAYDTRSMHREMDNLPW